MNSISAYFSLFTILSVVWLFSCAPQENVHEVSSEENMQSNTVSAFPETAGKGNTDMLENGHGNSSSGTDAQERKRAGWNLAKYMEARSALFGPHGSANSGLKSEMRMLMGSNTGMKNGWTITSGTNAGMGNGMSTAIGASTNMNHGVSMLSGTDTDFNTRMGSSMGTSFNFKNLFGAPMSDADTGTSMNTGLNRHHGNGMFMGSNSGWNFGIDMGSMAGMNTRSGAEERSERESSGSVMSGSNDNIDMAVGSTGMH